MTAPLDLRARYGGWALVAGASTGLGAAFADHLAARGLDVVLVARRQARTEQTAARIEDAHGVRTRTVVVDLAEDDAADRVLAATADLDLGLAVYNAAAEPEGLFLAGAREPLRVNLAVNCWTPTVLAQGLGARFVDRGRGALALVSSMAALQGIPRFAAYGAAKSYELILAEGLWDEWRAHGVDALGYVVGATASSTYRGAKATAYDGDVDPAQSRILSPATVDEVAERLLDRLHLGPRQYSHEADQRTAEDAATRSRADVVEAMGRLTAGLARFQTT